MNFTCANCNCSIQKNNNIYRGFDCTFCSTYCRTSMWTKIYQKDSTFNHPDKWDNKHHRIKNVSTWDIETKKEVSILDRKNDSVSSKNSNMRLNTKEPISYKGYDIGYDFEYDISNFNFVSLCYMNSCSSILSIKNLKKNLIGATSYFSEILGY